MNNPQVQQAVQKIDSLLAEYPTLCQYEQLRKWEKKTGYPKVYIFFAATCLLISFLFALGGLKLISDLVAFIYPAYMSFKAVDSFDRLDDTQWLTYWVVFAFFSIVESIAGFLLEWIPFYYLSKISFFVWLYHPKFMGAGLIYKQVVKPLVIPYVLLLSELSEKRHKKGE